MMTSSDPIADLLTRLRNAGMARLEAVRLPESKIKLGVANLLNENGYVGDVSRVEKVPQGEIVIRMRYDDSSKSAIRGIKRLSKPGRRLYVGVQDIPDVKNGLGVCILSTSKGLMTGSSARKLGIGGELLCEVW